MPWKKEYCISINDIPTRNSINIETPEGDNWKPKKMTSIGNTMALYILWSKDVWIDDKPEKLLDQNPNSTCDKFPNLNWLDKDKDKALKGIMNLVSMHYTNHDK